MEILEFASKYHYVYDNIGGKYRIPKLDLFQIKFFDQINSERNTLIKKPRQVFTTSMLATYMAWVLIYGKGDKTLVYSTNRVDICANFLRKVRLIIGNYCNDNGIEYRDLIGHRDNQRLLTMTNGNQLKGLSCSPENFVGFRIDEIVFDEAAYLGYLEETIAIILPQLSASPKSKIIVASSTNGAEFFHKLWVGSLNGENDFNTFNIRWDDVSGRDEAWFTEMCRMFNNDQRMIDQELLGKFITTVDNDIKRNTLQFRVDDETYSKFCSKLVETGMNQTDYLRKILGDNLG